VAPPPPPATTCPRWRTAPCRRGGGRCCGRAWPLRCRRMCTGAWRPGRGWRGRRAWTLARGSLTPTTGGRCVSCCLTSVTRTFTVRCWTASTATCTSCLSRLSRRGPSTRGGVATGVCWRGALVLFRECVSTPLMFPSRCVCMRPFHCIVRLMDLLLHSQGWRPHCAAHSGAHLYPGGGRGRVARGDRAGGRWFWFYRHGSACSYPGVRRPSPYGLRVPLYKKTLLE